MKKVLLVFVHNSGRSQMAEALFNQKSQAKAAAASAGTQPATQVNPTVVSAMREVGIEIADSKPKMLTPETPEGADRVITMGRNVAETCSAAFVPTEDRGLDDPEGRSIAKVREKRDEIKAEVDDSAGAFL